MHNLLTVKETAKYLRIPLPTVYYLVQRGQLPAIQIGGRWRIKKSSLDKDILKEDKSGQPTVLVVDDDESLQNLFKLFLKKIGFSRVVVGTVKEALAALDKQGECLGSIMPGQGVINFVQHVPFGPPPLHRRKPRPRRARPWVNRLDDLV